MQELNSFHKSDSNYYSVISTDLKDYSYEVSSENLKIKLYEGSSISRVGSMSLSVIVQLLVILANWRSKINKLDEDDI